MHIKRNGDVDQPEDTRHHEPGGSPASVQHLQGRRAASAAAVGLAAIDLDDPVAFLGTNTAVLRDYTIQTLSALNDLQSWRDRHFATKDLHDAASELAQLWERHEVALVLSDLEQLVVAVGGAIARIRRFASCLHRHRHGLLDPLWETVDVNGIAARALRQFRDRNRDAINARFAPGDLPACRVDIALLSFALDTMLDFVVSKTDRGGSVLIRTHAEPNNVVCLDAIRIDEHFDPSGQAAHETVQVEFQAADPTSDLALASLIASLHAGRLAHLAARGTTCGLRILITVNPCVPCSAT